MKIVVQIRRNADGAIRLREDTTVDPEWSDTDEYMWSDGNYGCDCNRGLFFALAGGDDEPTTECGDTAYSVRIVDGSGRELYADDDWTQ